jgi:hypothetical protein
MRKAFSDFQRELLSYCRSDVDILRIACLTFRQLFLEMTSADGHGGIDPFQKCIKGSGDRLRSPAAPGLYPGRDFRNYRHIYLNDNFEPTTPFLSDQKNLILSLNFVG